MRLEEITASDRAKLRSWIEKYIPSNQPCPRKRAEALKLQCKALTEALILIPEIVKANE